MYVLSSLTYLIMNDGQQRSDYYYNRMTFLLLQYFVKCCRQTSIAKALSKSSRQYSKDISASQKPIPSSLAASVTACVTFSILLKAAPPS